MRRMILTSLVLLPVLAHAQAGTATGPQPSTSSANVQAELTKPAGLTELAASAAPAASIVSAGTAMSGNAAIRESIQTRLAPSFTEAALSDTGTLAFGMSSTPVETSAPTVTRAVEIGLTKEELAAEPNVTRVVVRAVVDEYGFPRNLAVAQSAGAMLDHKALAAVSQYRF